MIWLQFLNLFRSNLWVQLRVCRCKIRVSPSARACVHVDLYCLPSLLYFFLHLPALLFDSKVGGFLNVCMSVSWLIYISLPLIFRKDASDIVRSSMFC